MTGQGLIDWVVKQLVAKKIPPTDAAILNFIRDWPGILPTQ
jgi:hypothetical protein